MSAQFAELGMAGGQNWMHVQFQEELFHAQKFFDYVIQRGGRALLTAIDKPDQEWATALAMFEHALAQLVTAQGCMERIQGNLPWREVKAKGTAIGKAVRLISQLDGSLDMARGGEIARNLRNLYGYMLNRLTTANVNNDPAIVAEVMSLLRTIKVGWDPLVKDGR